MKEEMTALKQQKFLRVACREYWIQTASNLGLVDSPNGVWFSPAYAVVAHVHMSTSEGSSKTDDKLP